MSTLASAVSAPVESIEVSAYTIPTDYPEADGTYSWDATTLVLVEFAGGGQRGLGYSYTSRGRRRCGSGRLAFGALAFEEGVP